MSSAYRWNSIAALASLPTRCGVMPCNEIEFGWMLGRDRGHYPSTGPDTSGPSCCSRNRAIIGLSGNLVTRWQLSGRLGSALTGVAGALI
jgi:hypothetical protein